MDSVAKNIEKPVMYQLSLPYDENGNVLQDENGNIVYHEEEVSAKRKTDKRRSGSLIETDFRKSMRKVNLLVEHTGICYLDKNGEKVQISNINTVVFKHTLVTSENGRCRVIDINSNEIVLSPKHMTSKSAFVCLIMSKGNLFFNGQKEHFDSFMKAILLMDNGKVVRHISGIGKIHPNIFYLGNEVLVNKRFQPYQETIWSDNQGFIVNYNKKVSIPESPFDLNTVCNRIDQVYGNIGIILLGFSYASIFFDRIMDEFGSFPVLYLSGKSGGGKTKISEIIAAMFGADYNMLAINCDSSSTKVGTEIMTQELHNMPLILNEINQEWFPFLKSRFDGEGSVRASKSNNEVLKTREVKSSTIAVSVEVPCDPQVFSRCLFIDVNTMEKKKVEYERLYKERKLLAGFIQEILLNATPDALFKAIKDVKKNLEGKGYEDRLTDNYSIIGGAMLCIADLLTDQPVYSKERICSFIEEEIKKAVNALNPLMNFFEEINSYVENDHKTDYIEWDDQYVYLKLKEYWNSLNSGKKKNFYRYYDLSAFKKSLISSDYIAKYGETLKPPKDKRYGDYAHSHPKKINKITARCIVLERNNLR
ncbi:MAG TPA: hypothetical protein PK816_05320 [Candidatus Cloacimonadota bacterium]|nr:hypothetical protein [Candidatus Cloacimonadota bacterium]